MNGYGGASRWEGLSSILIIILQEIFDITHVFTSLQFLRDFATGEECDQLKAIAGSRMRRSEAFLGDKFAPTNFRIR